MSILSSTKSGSSNVPMTINTLLANNFFLSRGYRQEIKYSGDVFYSTDFPNIYVVHAKPNFTNHILGINKESFIFGVTQPKIPTYACTKATDTSIKQIQRAIIELNKLTTSIKCSDTVIKNELHFYKLFREASLSLEKINNTLKQIYDWIPVAEKTLEEYLEE